MPAPLTFDNALAAWGYERVGRRAPSARAAQAACLLDLTPDIVKKRYRELAHAWHPDTGSAGRRRPADGGGSGGIGDGEEAEEKPDLHWLVQARDLLLERLEAEQERDRQRLAEHRRSLQQRQLSIARNFLAQLADRRLECSKHWAVSVGAVQPHFCRQKVQAGLGLSSYLGVTLSSEESSVRALVTNGGYLLDVPCDHADHLPNGLAFAHELLSLQRACDTRGWRIHQASSGNLSVRVGHHHSVVVTAQQLADGTATVAVLQAALDAEPALPARTARTAGLAGAAGLAPAPATAARRDRGLCSAAGQPTHAAPAAADAPKRRPEPTVAQRMMEASDAPVPDAADGRVLIKEVEVGSSILSHRNFSISYKTDVPKLVGEDWDGQAAVLSIEDIQGRQYELRVKAHNEIVKQKFEVTKYRVYFSRTLLLDNQVRLGEVLKIWRAAGGGLQLEFENPQSAAQPSASARGGVGASQQRSTGSKRARRE